MARWLSLVAVPAVLFTIGCGAPTSSPEDALSFDPCSALAIAPDAEATPEQRQAVADAVALWNARAGTRMSMPALAETLPGPQATVTMTDAPATPPVVPVHFQGAAAPFHGFYDAGRGEVFINDDLGDHPRVVAIAHELGHAFGLVHISTELRPSVMNSGNLAIEPTSDDVATLAGLWGACM